VRALFVVLILAVGLMALSACTTGPGADSATTDAGLDVTLVTNPASPQVGNVELVVELKDAANRPVTGGTVLLKADMIGHSMGDLSGTATDQGNGRYAITANLSMAGEWKVDVDARAGDQAVAKDFRINVK
jgi:nitrogen fixation protein FixH